VTEIIKYPAEILQIKCLPVEDIEEFRKTVALDLTFAASREGVAGVAAPQLGFPFRAFAMRLRGEVRVLVNPRMMSFFAPEDIGEEGCLSVPGRRFSVFRKTGIEVAAYLPDGSLFDFPGAGFEARVIQHEMDHLDGILIIDRAREQASRLPRQLRRANERELAKVDR
jgi:peptide deformylase